MSSKAKQNYWEKLILSSAKGAKKVARNRVGRAMPPSLICY